MTFTRKLSEAEIDAESRRLSGLVKKLIDTEEEKSQVNKEYGDIIKETKTLMNESSKVISKGQKEVHERVYKFINYETREVMFYDSLGNLVRVREALPEELQADMFGSGDAKNLENNQNETKALEDHSDYTDYEEVEDNE